MSAEMKERGEAERGRGRLLRLTVGESEGNRSLESVRSQDRIDDETNENVRPAGDSEAHTGKNMNSHKDAQAPGRWSVVDVGLAWPHVAMSSFGLLSIWLATR